MNAADNTARTAAAGGIDAVVGAMRAHRGVADLQEQGCAALESLGRSKFFQFFSSSSWIAAVLALIIVIVIVFLPGEKANPEL